MKLQALAPLAAAAASPAGIAIAAAAAATVVMCRSKALRPEVQGQSTPWNSAVLSLCPSLTAPYRLPAFLNNGHVVRRLQLHEQGAAVGAWGAREARRQGRGGGLSVAQVACGGRACGSGGRHLAAECHYTHGASLAPPAATLQWTGNDLRCVVSSQAARPV